MLSLAVLHTLTLIHTDLKPENILLVSSDYDKEPADGAKQMKRVPRSHKIRLIDFGSATYQARERAKHNSHSSAVFGGGGLPPAGAALRSAALRDLAG